MVMRVDVVVACLEDLEMRASTNPDAPERSRRVLLSPQGSVLDQAKVEELAGRAWITLVCGRYEGFDDRVHSFVDEEISLGDFVMAGGEVAAMAIVDACSRLLPGVLGSADSAMHESHSPVMFGLLEHPHYTRPEEFRGLGVPDVLKGGNHASIAAWRRSMSEQRTAERRPELLERAIRKREERGTS
jgi:tRNA (guanine37-N1)-methyltransferase